MESSMIINLLEAITIFCFGLSWPISIRKSYLSRTAKGKSLFFEVFLIIGRTLHPNSRFEAMALYGIITHFEKPDVPEV